MRTRCPSLVWAAGLFAAAAPAAFARPAQDATGGGVTYANQTPTPIVDLGTVNSTITVSGAFPWLTDVNLRTFLSHTYALDLEITLASPAGTVVTITTDNGGPNIDVFHGTLWDDDAGTPVTDAAYDTLVVETPLVPEEAMGAFVGEDPNGVWTLTVTDDELLDAGTLHAWSLSIATLASAPATALTTVTANVPIPLPDETKTLATLDVSGAPPFLVDLDAVTFITHTFASDLDIRLISPSGTVVTLTSNNGSGHDNVFNGTVWDDGAGVPVTDASFANLVVETPLVPEGAFGAFIGEDPNGTWTLSVADEADLDTGSLDSWELQILSTDQNVVLGDAGDAYATKGTFTIDWASHADGTAADAFTLSGVLNPAGILADLSDAALSVTVNRALLAPTVNLLSEGTYASASGATPVAKHRVRGTNGAYSVRFGGLDLRPILGLANATEEGTTGVLVEVSVVGGGMLLSSASGSLLFDYKTTQDRTSKGKFAFKTTGKSTGVFQSLKTQATEQSGGGHAVKASGPILSDTGGPVEPNADLTLTIGTATPVTIPFASLVLDGTGVDGTVTLASEAVAELKSFSISNRKRAFAFQTNEKLGTGIPPAGAGEPLAHYLPISLTVPTGSGTLDFASVVEIKRRSETSGSWKR